MALQAIFAHSRDFSGILFQREGRILFSWDETELDDMIGLLDTCLASSPPVGTVWEAEEALAASIITDKQLRALSKKHLLMMIRDLEKELLREKTEMAHLLGVCGAGPPRGRRAQRAAKM